MLDVGLLALPYFLLIGRVLRCFLSYFACVKISFGNGFYFLHGLEGFVKNIW